ncbi:MAG: hypothetical protein ABUL56_02750 [Actinomycetota bacterium]
MSKTLKVGVLMAAVALGGLWATSAGAAEWHTNGSLAFSSTNAGAVVLVVHHDGIQTVTISCSASAITGTLNGPTSLATPWVNAATVTPLFSAAGNCTMTGTPGYTFVCGTGELRVNSYAGGTTLATAGGGVTTGSLKVDCRVAAGASQCSTITGSLPAHYTNPNPITSGAGRLTLTGAGLVAQKIGAGCAWLPNGTATVGPLSGSTSVGDLTFTMDGPNAPYIYRTP